MQFLESRAKLAATNSSEPIKINKRQILDDDADKDKENTENLKNSALEASSSSNNSTNVTNNTSEETSSTKKRKLILDDDEDDKSSAETKPSQMTAKYISSIDTNPLSKARKKNPEECSTGASQPPFRIQKKKILPPSSSSVSVKPSLISGSSSQILPPVLSSSLVSQSSSSSIPPTQPLSHLPLPPTNPPSTDNARTVNRTLSHSPPSDPRLRFFPKLATEACVGTNLAPSTTSTSMPPPQVTNHNGTQDTIPNNQNPPPSASSSATQTIQPVVGGIAAFLSQHKDDSTFSKSKRRKAPAQLQIYPEFKERDIALKIASTSGPVSPTDLSRRATTDYGAVGSSRSSSLVSPNTPPVPYNPQNSKQPTTTLGPVSPTDPRGQSVQRMPSSRNITGPISPTDPMRAEFPSPPTNSPPVLSRDTRKLASYPPTSSNTPVTQPVDISKERPSDSVEKPSDISKSNTERPPIRNGPISPSSIVPNSTTPFKPPTSRPMIAGPISPSDPNRSTVIAKSNSDKTPSTTTPQSSPQTPSVPFNRPPSSYRSGPISPSDTRRQEDRFQRKEQGYHERSYEQKSGYYSSSNYYSGSSKEYYSSSSSRPYYEKSSDRYHSPSLSYEKRQSHSYIDTTKSYKPSLIDTSHNNERSQSSSAPPTLTNSPSSSASSLDSLRSNETEGPLHVVESDIELTDGVNLKISNLHIQAFVKGTRDPKFTPNINVDGTAKWDFENHGRNAIRCFITSQEPNDLPSLDKQASDLKKNKNAFRAKWDLDGRRYKVFIYPSCREVRSAFSMNPPDFPLIGEPHFVALLQSKTSK